MPSVCVCERERESEREIEKEVSLTIKKEGFIRIIISRVLNKTSLSHS